MVSAAALPPQGYGTLVTLDLEDCGLAGAELAAVARSLRDVPSLRCLSLRSNRLDVTGATQLAKLLQFQTFNRGAAVVAPSSARGSNSACWRLRVLPPPSDRLYAPSRACVHVRVPRRQAL